MFYPPTVLKVEHFKAYISAQEIVFSMREDEISVLERTYDIYPRRGFG